MTSLCTLSSADWSSSPRWISPQSLSIEYRLTVGRCILRNAEFRIRVICGISDAELTAGLDDDVRYDFDAYVHSIAPHEPRRLPACLLLLLLNETMQFTVFGFPSIDHHGSTCSQVDISVC